MAEEGTRSRLGRGLAALIGDVGQESSTERPRSTRKLPTGALKPNPRNPRRAFAAAELEELAASLRERGIIQPIVVRALRGNGGYEIVAGERRWRAAQRAGLHEVPVVVVEATDAEALQLAIVENVQRADLNAVEEAEGYHALMEQFRNSQDEIAKVVGKSRSHIANTLRLLKLPDAVKTLMRDGKLTAGHARMLIGEPNAEALAQEIVARGLNVREVEAMARDRADQRGAPRGKSKKTRRAAAKDADVLAFEKKVSDATGLVVTIDNHGERGTLSIRYRTLEQLDALVQKLARR